MPNIRCTAFFKDDDGHGWSETHDRFDGTSSPSLGSLLANFNSLMETFRRPLLAGDAYYIGCRASYKTAQNTTAGDNIEKDPAMRGVQSFSGESWEMTAPEVAVKMRIRNDAATQRSDVYLRGMPSQCVLAGVLNFGSLSGAEWKRRCDFYAAELIAKSYGWVGTAAASTSRGKATGYGLNTNGTVTVNVTPLNGVLLPAAGTRLPVKFARFNGSKSIMNRSFVCVVETGGAAVTTTEKVNPVDFVGEGTYIATISAFIPYNAVSYFKLAKRATGRPFGVGRGRSPTKVLF